MPISESILFERLMRLIRVSGLVIVSLLICGCGSDSVQLPETPKKQVIDTYHGVRVVEEYRWLEDFTDPAVKKWSDSQNQYARAILDNIPEREPIINQLRKIYSEASSEYYSIKYRPGRLFALKYQPPAEKPSLVTFESVNNLESELVILDLNELNPDGTTSIDFYVPSRDGKLIAVSLSQKGSEIGTVHIYETVTGNEIGDTIPRVNGPTAGGSVAWNADGSGFYYTRYPRAGERSAEDMNFYQQVYFHKMGTPTEDDVYSTGKQFPRIAEIELETSEDGQFILATVANGDGGEYDHHVLSRDGKWKRISHFSDKITKAVIGPDNYLYLLSKKDAPRGKIIKLDLANPELKSARTIVPESDVVIRSICPTSNRLYVVDLVGGPSQVRIFDNQDQELGLIPILPVSSVWGLTRLEGDALLFNNVDYLTPDAWYLYDPVNDLVTKTPLFLTSPVNLDGMEVIREQAVSKDGTEIPMNILRRKGIQLDGQNPTLLTGYGGFGISRTPGFSPKTSLWLKQGGVYVIANLRGGGEFGEEWHLAGNLTNKQNVFDDFIACAEYLIETGYTEPGLLAIEGGSNGGLLMGAALTQRPELFRAVVAHVGIFDMVRYVQSPNGVFNIPEYGSVDDPDQFRAIYDYSPYHHVIDGTAYPDILLLTGEHDGRVDPANSRKMTARLQAAGASVFLRTSSITGHGGASFSEKINKSADVFAFLFSRLEMEYKSD